MTSEAVEAKQSTQGSTSSGANSPNHPRETEGTLSRIRVDFAVGVASVIAIVIGVYLLFREVDFTGLTWDEWVDYGVAEDYAKNKSFIDNTTDPSQARFSHLVGAASFALLGVSYFAFKLPFVLAGIGGGLGLWLFLRRRVTAVVALLAAAMYFTCPYMLAAARAGATAGDVLVCILVLAFIIVNERWIDTERFWPYGALSGVVCGLAVGAKWTCALLIVSAVITRLLARRARGKRLLDSTTWTAFLAHWWLAVVFALLACPTLLLGIKFIRGALAHSIQFEGKHLILLGMSRPSAPWYYIPAVLASKVSSIQLLVLVVAVVQAARNTFRRHHFDTLGTLCLLSLLPSVPLAFKAFQNAHYYLPLIPVMMILTAKTVDRWLSRGGPWSRHAVHLGGLVALAAQVVLSISLFPDYLQAGSQFGPVFEGEFPGPAINHCQGLPYAVRELNALIDAGGPRRAYSLQSCREVMTHAAERGPIRARVEIRPYPSDRPHEAHYVIIPAIYDYESKDEREHQESQARKRAVTSGCRRVGTSHPDFRIYECPKS